jgi:hypothetical protein
VRELTQPAFGAETWYEQNFNTVKYLLLCMALAPELAPADEDHLLGTAGGEPSGIEYAPAQIVTTWTAPGRAIFKLRERPSGVRFAGVWQIAPVAELAGLEAGWTWDAAAQVCTVQHPAGELLVALAGATSVADGERPAARPDQAAARLLPPFPMPANPRVRLPFALRAGGHARLTIHDARGRLVAVLLDAPMPPGTAEVDWGGEDAGGHPAASGVYTVRLTALGQVDQRRLVLAR